MERSRLCGLLAHLFRTEPTPELLHFVLSASFQEALGELAIPLRDGLADRPQEEVLEELAAEFARLFLGPGNHISPHESVQINDQGGSLWGAETVAVKGFIEAAGFVITDQSPNLPDHLSVELDFLSHLAKLESESWRQGDLTATGNTLDWQADFIANHIGKWVDKFCKKIAERRALPFYQLFSEVLKQFITHEIGAIGQRQAIFRRLQQEISDNV